MGDAWKVRSEFFFWGFAWDLGCFFFSMFFVFVLVFCVGFSLSLVFLGIHKKKVQY